jgi:hypothetical protein
VRPPGGRARVGRIRKSIILILSGPRAPQALPPIERHEPIPMDKIALFEVAPVHRLVGTWQGPGTIAGLRSRR